jgi:hypothetical protein
MPTIIVTKRLGQALANFDVDNITGGQCDDRVAAVLEAVHQAHEGLILESEMCTKIERALGGKLEYLPVRMSESEPERDQMGARLDGQGESEPPGRALTRQLAESEVQADLGAKLPHVRGDRLQFSSAGATRRPIRNGGF